MSRLVLRESALGVPVEDPRGESSLRQIPFPHQYFLSLQSVRAVVEDVAVLRPKWRHTKDQQQPGGHGDHSDDSCFSHLSSFPAKLRSRLGPVFRTAWVILCP